MYICLSSDQLLIYNTQKYYLLRASTSTSLPDDILLDPDPLALGMLFNDGVLIPTLRVKDTPLCASFLASMTSPLIFGVCFNLYLSTINITNTCNN